jgi:hypothetical protein
VRENRVEAVRIRDHGPEAEGEAPDAAATEPAEQPFRP